MARSKLCGVHIPVCGRVKSYQVLAASAAVALVLSVPAIAQGQSANSSNSGALKFTSGFDVLPGVPFIFRGIVQESNPKLTLWPHGDVGIALISGDSGLRRLGVNLGIWNSLQTGSSGSDGPTTRLHYWEDFYATLTAGFGAGVNFGTTFTAYTSPNGTFTTVEELSFKLSRSDWLAPYGLLALELSDDGQADVGVNKGTYLEIGVGPSWLIGRGPTFSIPVKLGLSLKDYYEGPAGDQKFGFVDVGGLFTVPLKGVPSQFGSWNFHAGADVLVYPGEDSVLRLLNDGDSSKVVGLIGFGITY